MDNERLQELAKKEWDQSNRLNRYNEELQYKLQQHKEVLARVVRDPDVSVMQLGSSFSDNSHTKQHLNRTLSFRERSDSRHYSPDNGNRHVSFIFRTENQQPT